MAELEACEGNMASAARNLGLTERQIGLRVKRFGIDFKRFRRGDGFADRAKFPQADHAGPREAHDVPRVPRKPPEFSATLPPIVEIFIDPG